MRSGAALPAVLFATAMASALAVGGAYIARQQAVHARLSIRAAQVQPAAEEALAIAIAGWDSVARSAQPIGSSEAVPVASQPAMTVQVWITRTSTELFWLVAESATAQPPALKRRLGVLVRARSGLAAPVPDRAWSDLP